MKNNWWSPHSRRSPRWIQTRLRFSVSPFSAPLPSPTTRPDARGPRAPREKCSFVTCLSRCRWRRIRSVPSHTDLRETIQLRLNDSRLQCEVLFKAKRIETWLDSMWRIHSPPINFKCFFHLHAHAESTQEVSTEACDYDCRQRACVSGIVVSVRSPNLCISIKKGVKFREKTAEHSSIQGSAYKKNPTVTHFFTPSDRSGQLQQRCACVVQLCYCCFVGE